MLFNKTNTYYFVISAGIIMTSLLCSLYFNNNSASAYTASITTNDSIELDIAPSGDGTSIHSESINVQSDCRAGYNLTIATPEGSSLYKYENNTQAGTASFTAVDGTSALNNSNNTNKWGYTLTTNPTSSTVFLPLSSTQAVLKTPSQTASLEADINDTFDINYGAKVSDSVDPGTYQMANNGAIVYYLTMDTTCTQYTVSFNPNGGTGTMENQGIEAGEPIKLTSADSLTAPTGTSYTDADNNTITGDPDKLWTFWGWNTSADGTGDWYKDKEAVENLTSVGSTITLYAQWKQATLADLTTGTQVGTEKVIDHNLMQDMSPEACWNSEKFTAIGTPYGQVILLDKRDGITRTYTVAKLPDDACWMTDNLNLGTTTSVILTPDDTDIIENFTLPASDPNDFSTSIAQANYNKATVLNDLTIPDYTVNSTIYSGKISGYYSYAAATADINTYSRNSETLLTNSICPRNWDLPSAVIYYNLRTKGSIATYNNTNASYTGKNAGNEPYRFVYGGYRKATGDSINTTSFTAPTSQGYLWTANNSTYRYGYSTYISSSGLYNNATGTTYNKYYGLGIRCVASKGKATVKYNGNGTAEYPVTGTTSPQVGVEINTANTRTNSFIRAGWVFNGWNTAADGSGDSISIGTSIATLGVKPGETITLYAQWLPQYSITYVNNCETYVSDNSSCTQSVSNGTSSQKINLDTNGDGSGTMAAYNQWTITGWKIKGWSTVADNISNTNTEYKVGSNYSVTSQGAGDGITLYAHWVPIYAIQYDGNGASNSNGMGATDANTGEKSVRQTNVAEGDDILLLASNFVRTGYGFAGWSTDSNAWAHFTDNDNGNDPVIYGPMETIEAPAYPTNNTNIATMYAVWVPAEKDGSNNPVYLQEWDDLSNPNDGCATLTATTFDDTVTNEKDKITVNKNSVIALTDKRDNQVYTVAKLADGNCWIVENLRLDSQYTMGQNQNDNTLTNEGLAQGYGGTPGTYGSFVGLANSESSYFSVSSTASNSIYKASANPPVDTYNPLNNTLEDIGTSNSPAYRFPRYNNNNTNNLIDSTTFTQNYANAASPSTSGTYMYGNLYSYGNYYNWAAGTANTNYFTNNEAILSEGADTSICPAGWRLPSGTGETTAQGYANLSESYEGTGGEQGNADDVGTIMSNRFRTFPNNFLFAGYFSGSNSYSRASTGNYLTSSSARGSNVFYNYSLYLASTSLGPAHRNYKYYGYTVRCFINRAYIIQYEGNGADNPNGMGVIEPTGKKTVKQVEISEGKKVGLLASNFKKAGYGFAGWSTDQDAWAHFIDNDNTNDPIIYGPMEDIIVDSGLTNSANNRGIITMYAVWVPAEKDGNDNPVYLQEWDDPSDLIDGCATLTATTFDDAVTNEKGKISVNKNSVIALTDKRDNMVYTIAKLADGNCWMIENLRLDSQYTMGQNQNDSTVTNESLSQGYGGTPGIYGNFVGLPDSEVENFSASIVSNSVYKSSTDPPVDTYDPLNNTLEDIGTADNPGLRFPRYNNSNTGDLVDSTIFFESYASVAYPDGYESGTYSFNNVYSYGNYYNQAAAMANTNYYANTTALESANTSICPTGWHLPSSGTAAKEYNILLRGYGGNDSGYSGTIIENRLRSFPNNFLYSGYIRYGNGFAVRGSAGRYLSRSRSSGLYIYSGSISPSADLTTTDGHAVRCLMGS